MFCRVRWLSSPRDLYRPTSLKLALRSRFAPHDGDQRSGGPVRSDGPALSSSANAMDVPPPDYQRVLDLLVGALELGPLAMLAVRQAGSIPGSSTRECAGHRTNSRQRVFIARPDLWRASAASLHPASKIVRPRCPRTSQTSCSRPHQTHGGGGTARTRAQPARR